MPRSARRRSVPSSPAKSRQAIIEASPRQTRRSARTQSRDPSAAAIAAAIQKTPLARVAEDEDDRITVRSPIQARKQTISVDNDASHVLDEAEGSSELDDLSASEEEEEPLDKELIIDNLAAVNQDADDLLSLIGSLPADKLFAAVQDRLSSTSKRLVNIESRLRRDAEPCGKESLLQVSKLSAIFTGGSGTDRCGAEPIFMKVNLALFLSMLLSGRAAGQDQRTSDLLASLIDLESFPQPFIQRPASRDSDPSLFEHGFDSETIRLGISILTQCFVRTAMDQATDSDFNAESLLQNVFLGEDAVRLRDISTGIHPANSNKGLVRVEKRMQDISNFITLDTSNPVDLLALQTKYPWNSFLKEALAWSSQRARQLNGLIEESGGAQAIRNSLQEGIVVATPNPKAARGKKKKDKARRKSQKEKSLEGVASYLNNLDDKIKGTSDESLHDEQEEGASEQYRSEIESESHGVEGDNSHDVSVGAGHDQAAEAQLQAEAAKKRKEVEGDGLPTTIEADLSDRERRRTIEESPVLEEPPPRVLQSLPLPTIEEDHGSSAAPIADDDINNNLDEEQGAEQEQDQDLPDSAQPAPPSTAPVSTAPVSTNPLFATHWASQPSKESEMILAAVRQQEATANKENRRPKLTDPQPNARSYDFDGDVYNKGSQQQQAQSRKNGKRPRKEAVEDSDDEEFEQDTRGAKRPRPTYASALGRSGKVPATAPARSREDFDESSMFANDNDVPEVQDYHRNRQNTNRPSATQRPNSHQRHDHSRNPSQSARPGPSTTQPSSHQSPSRPRHADHDLPPSSFEDYMQTKTLAKRNLVLSAILNPRNPPPKPPQTRRPWSAEEIIRLMELMKDHDCSWSVMLKVDAQMVDPKLQSRSQVQLKDKARNMKLEFLKAEQMLPEGFERVTISKNHKEMLREKGFPFVEREELRVERQEDN